MSDKGIAERIREVFSIDPSRVAIEQSGQTWSWGRIAALMAQIEARLGESEVAEGAVVGILLRNRPAHVAAMLQVLLSARCVVTINPFQSPSKIAADLAALQCPVYLADEDDWRIDEVAQVARDGGALMLALDNSGDLAVRQIQALQCSATDPRFHAPLPGVGIQMLTSGTTGPAKRVQLAYRNFERALLDALFYEAGARDGEVRLRDSLVLAVQPLVHIGGIWGVVSAFSAGRGVALLEKFSVETWHAAVKQHKPKLAALPPTAIKMVFDAGVPREDIASLLAIRSGTAPLDPDFQEAFEARYGIPILNAYGATEFAGGVAGWTLADHRTFVATKRASVGRAQPGCQLRIVDRETFAELSSGQVGLLEVRAKHIGDGTWLRTTDLAEIDADGFLFIRGRADDAIIRGGFKVLPLDVAKAFLKHPSVKDVSIVGIKDERLGAVPVAAVELHEGAEPVTEVQLLALAREHLTSYQVPVAVKIVDALPRTPSLKVAQPAVRALFEGV